MTQTITHTHKLQKNYTNNDIKNSKTTATKQQQQHYRDRCVRHASTMRTCNYFNVCPPVDRAFSVPRLAYISPCPRPQILSGFLLTSIQIQQRFVTPWRFVPRASQFEYSFQVSLSRFKFERNASHPSNAVQIQAGANCFAPPSAANRRPRQTR